MPIRNIAFNKTRRALPKHFVCQISTQKEILKCNPTSISGSPCPSRGSGSSEGPGASLPSGTTQSSRGTSWSTWAAQSRRTAEAPVPCSSRLPDFSCNVSHICVRIPAPVSVGRRTVTWCRREIAGTTVMCSNWLQTQDFNEKSPEAPNVAEKSAGRREIRHRRGLNVEIMYAYS